jgi:hypothetical protein
MIRVQQLREKAERLRHLAGIPTSGGALANRHLVDLANRWTKRPMPGRKVNPRPTKPLEYANPGNFSAGPARVNLGPARREAFAAAAAWERAVRAAPEAA